VLWTGYLALEGFDFGVGMLLPILGKGRDADDTEKRRRVMLNTIGPVWDGNEVWLLTAGGATFAAFPHWYATMFSGFYLPLLLILVALIVRNMGFDYRGKRDVGDLEGPLGPRDHHRLLRPRAAVGRRADQCGARCADR
jgi:cytochrome d ubiquinol oxidase subunit II